MHAFYHHATITGKPLAHNDMCRSSVFRYAFVLRFISYEATKKTNGMSYHHRIGLAYLEFLFELSGAAESLDFERLWRITGARVLLFSVTDTSKTRL